MKKKPILVFFSGLMFFLFVIDAFAVYRPKRTLTKIKSGSYDPTILITRGKLRSLPVPRSNENYAFYQSIGKVTNIVLGKFQQVDQEIILITDNDSDGKVDRVFVYDVLSKKNKNIKKVYSDEEFLQLKKDIFNGTNASIGVNKEGVEFIKKLITSNSDLVKIARAKLGYRIQIFDPDDPKSYRTKFLFSKGVYGADLAFEVAYYNVRETHVKPIIEKCVYASSSRDAYAQSVVKELIEYTEKNIIFD